MSNYSTNAKFEFGDAKPPITEIPPVAIFLMGQVMLRGSQKYGPFNWRDNGVDIRTYVNAMARHMFAYWDGQDCDPETGIPHLAHVMACCGIILDLHMNGDLTDNRPANGPLPEWLEQNGASPDKRSNAHMSADEWREYRKEVGVGHRIFEEDGA